MKSLESEWFTPKYQEKGKGETQFKVRPLDQRMLFFLQSNMGPKGPNTEAAFECFSYAVTDWKINGLEFSEQAKRDVMTGVGQIRWTIWLGQIAAHLYRKALLPESERKN